ncbi:hypothetical protein AVEN_103001-1 [Araneus ventricosus]|uniref:Uncharacterized protein n=1 Tax=Araneus ventricosus TaxID=182803 RepID=A0A4Y2BB45_ARAVE|nr:hypothetical protein AVEN_103001-1 [Araneus ventricosus]
MFYTERMDSGDLHHRSNLSQYPSLHLDCRTIKKAVGVETCVQETWGALHIEEIVKSGRSGSEWLVGDGFAWSGAVVNDCING